MATVVDRDLGWRHVMRIMTASFTSHARVGILEGEVSAQGDVRNPGGMSGATGKANLAQIAAFNEFGTSTIPARPFMGRTVDVNAAKYQQMLALGFSDMLIGRMTQEQVLNELGLEGQKDMKKSLTGARAWAQANAPTTIAQKGSSQPLIDFGTMRNAVAFDVVKGR